MARWASRALKGGLQHRDPSGSYFDAGGPIRRKCLASMGSYNRGKWFSDSVGGSGANHPPPP